MRANLTSAVPRLGWAILVATLGACDRPDSASNNQTLSRWYTTAQVEQGRTLFQTHCSACHGSAAEGTPNWFERDANGNYPPPPLDDSAHAWHHPLNDLKKVIQNGGVPYGGTMPAFGATLTDQDISAVIAFFQQTWSDEIYERWTALDAASKEPTDSASQ